MAEPPGIIRVARDWRHDDTRTVTIEAVLPPKAVLDEAAARRRERTGQSDPDLDGILGWLEETLKRI